MNPKAVGERTEAVVLAALVKRGKVVLLPFGDNQRYDLVVDENGIFTRIQCKTGRLVKGSVVFSTCSSQAHRSKGRQGYKGQAELFGVYCPDNDKVYLVPVDDVGVGYAYLRVDPTNQPNVRWAGQYEL